MLNSHNDEEDRKSSSYNAHSNHCYDEKDFDSISNFSESTVMNSDYVEARIKYHERQQQIPEMQHYNQVNDANKYLINIKVDALHIYGDKNNDEGKGCFLKLLSKIQ